MTTTAQKVLNDVAEKLQNQMDKTNADVTVFATQTKMPIVNQFVLLFYSSFLETIDDYKLTLNDIRVMLKICEYMKFVNLVHMSFATVARDLDIKPQNISRHIKKLKDAKLLLDDGGNIFLNPQIIAKGKFLEKRGDKEAVKLLQAGAEALEGTGIKPNIVTKKRNEYEQASLLSQN